MIHCFGRRSIFKAALSSLFFFVFLSSSAWCQKPVVTTKPDADLSPRIGRMLDQEILPALQAGDDESFYTLFGALLSKSDNKSADAIETYAAEQGHPSLIKHFVKLKLRRVEQSVDSPNEDLSLREVGYLIQGINENANDFRKQVSELPLMNDKVSVPEDWKEGLEMFWNAHVAKNEFVNYQRIMEYGRSILMAQKRRFEKTENDSIKKELDEFQKHFVELPELHEKLVKGELEGRLIRFNRSLDEIQSKKDFRSRFLAAMSIEFDSEVVLSGLTGSWQVNINDRFPQEVAGDVRKNLAETRKQFPQILVKARLFRDGLHWWLRGRYGMSTSGGGLLKPSSALKSDVAMNRLYMPRKRPEPVFTAGEGITNNAETPYFNRRHYYTWAVEYRPLITKSSSKETKSTSRTNVGSKEITGDFFY